jgi:5-methylthioadenosine/S-adenosylhomocysteine deaminase
LVGANTEIGSIEAGKKADLILLDPDVPSMRPVVRVLTNVVQYGHPGIVRFVMVDGDLLMRARRVLTVDGPEALGAAQAVIERRWQDMLVWNPNMPPAPDSPAWPHGWVGMR